jgi:AP-1 complex subunit mu
MVFTFLESLKVLLQECLGNLETDAVRENAILIYELLDEVMDNGYPQTTDSKILKKYITSKATIFKDSKKRRLKKDTEIVQGMTGPIPWRSGTYKYSKNEVYLDTIEKVNMVITTSGQVLKSEVQGVLRMKCHLSGMPELLLGLNDKRFFDLNQNGGASSSSGGSGSSKRTVDIQDIKFHQCVRLARFENDGSISFVPPDGEFDLVNYRMECPFKALFNFEITYEKQTERHIHFYVKAKTNYKARVNANFVEFWMAMPNDAQNVVTKASQGSARYLPENGVLSWKIMSLEGKKEVNLEVKLEVPSLSSHSMAFRNQPVRVMFEIPYYTLSGLVVKYLKIKDQSGYTALSWVRYLAMNGEFVIRTNQNLK